MSDTNALIDAVHGARAAMAVLGHDTKLQVLSRLSSLLGERQEEILAANQVDVERSRQEGLASHLVKRLVYDAKKIDESIKGLEALAGLPDALGRVSYARELDEGLELYRVACPIGTLAMIFESRPDALVQMAGLALKSGNTLILKGGREALETNRILAGLVLEASRECGLDAPWLGLLESRDDVVVLLQRHDAVDLVIPRGSNEFVQYIMKNTLIPVMGHADGICHAYVHRDADLSMAERLVVDAKAQYVAVCNAVETLLVDRLGAQERLPALGAALERAGVTLYGCPETVAILGCAPVEEPAWKTEYLDYRISVRVVDGLDEAISHINTYGSGHTELVITQSPTVARRFMQEVDAANVFWNASTRFADGYRYGFGAEVGISTGKLHARGPVGLEGLLTYKYKLFGKGHRVADYSGPEGRAYTHRRLGAEKEPWK